jgi:glutamate 5-kinase
MRSEGDRICWVVKVGSSLLADQGVGLNEDAISDLVAQVAALRDRGIDVVLVSSGAIAAGMLRLGWTTRPRELHRLQVAAAVGQSSLVKSYETWFNHQQITTCQVLLTDADLADRSRYLNARSALKTMLDLGLVPIVNENDTVVTHEIQFGDNDTLAALVTNLIEAECLVILTDQAGLFDADPRRSESAVLMREAIAGDPSLKSVAGPGGIQGRGGMLSKIHAAEKAARSGADTFIVSGHRSNVLLEVAAGENPGTRIRAVAGRIAARKQWLAGQLRVAGRLHLDAGATRVIQNDGRSLLPVGVTHVEGEFERGDLVACITMAGQVEIARGLINYSAIESRQIIGRASHDIESILGYVDEPELIHRDNLVVL